MIQAVVHTMIGRILELRVEAGAIVAGGYSSYLMSSRGVEGHGCKGGGLCEFDLAQGGLETGC